MRRTNAKIVNIELIQPIAHNVIMHQYRGCLEEIAYTLNTPYTTFASQLTDPRAKSIDFDLLRQAEAHTGSPELGEILVYPGRRIGAAAAPISKNADAATQCIEAVEAVTDTTACLRKALEDGKVTPNELNEILASAARGHAELDDLEALARAWAGKPPAPQTERIDR